MIAADSVQPKFCLVDTGDDGGADVNPNFFPIYFLTTKIDDKKFLRKSDTDALKFGEEICCKFVNVQVKWGIHDNSSAT